MTSAPLTARLARHWRTIGVTLLLVLTAVVAFALGRAGTPHVEEVECFSADGAIGCTLDDGWDVSVPLDVAWTDDQDVFHGNGRPECLPPTGRVQEPVQVAWTEVEVDSTGWREVVWVGC